MCRLKDLRSTLPSFLLFFLLLLPTVSAHAKKFVQPSFFNGYRGSIECDAITNERDVLIGFFPKGYDKKSNEGLEFHIRIKDDGIYAYIYLKYRILRELEEVTYRIDNQLPVTEKMNSGTFGTNEDLFWKLRGSEEIGIKWGNGPYKSKIFDLSDINDALDFLYNEPCD